MLKNTQNESQEISLDLINNVQQKITDAGFTLVESFHHIPEIDRWSVHIRDRDCPLVHSYGQGHSKQSAILDALEAFIRRIATHHVWSECYFGDELSNNKWVHFPQELWFSPDTSGSWPTNQSHEILNAELRRFYNPNNELYISNLIDSHSSYQERGICCLPYTGLNTSETVYFPINIITNIYHHNGMSVGNSTIEAQLNSLSNIIKNYVKCKVIAEGLCLPNIPINVLNRYPEIMKQCTFFKHGNYSITIKDASLAGQYPAVAITLINSDNQTASMSFGAHPVLKIALEQAFNELIHNFFIYKIQNSEIGFNQDEIASPTNLAKHFKHANGIIPWACLKNHPNFEYKDWDTQTNLEDPNQLKQRFDQLYHTIHSTGHEVYCFNHQVMGVHTCHMIIPSLSEVFPIDDLVWENDNIGMTVRNLILKPHKTLNECEELIIALEALGQGDEILISKLIGMPSDPDSLFEDLTLSELITLLALKTQDNERIQEGCEWLLHYKKIKPYRLKVYHCIDTLLQLDGMVTYSIALEKIYTKEVLTDALALLDGEDVFPLLSNWKLHKSLINAYRKMVTTINEKK